METATWIPNEVSLVPDTFTRNRAIAKIRLKAGSQLLSNSAYATILLDSEKGRRCDFCFTLPLDGSHLKRCTGCGAYWYCNQLCQTVQWKDHHKRICKTYNSFLVSHEYQALADYQKLDSILLSHVVAQLSLLPIPYALQDLESSSLLMSLLPSDESISHPPIFPIKPAPPDGLLNKLYARFSNNNFAIHSHLNTIGHGVFPPASRLFNHSCLPNAAAKYQFAPGMPVQMDIVALRDIAKEEEICLTYLDPALLETREQMLEISYGFQCQCPTSIFLRRIGPLPDVPTSEKDILQISQELQEFIGFDSTKSVNQLPTKSIDRLPASLYCVLRESYMAGLSETFSKASHEGQYDVASSSGTTLLSLYLLVYPVNYPQIGNEWMHLLEMAKTTWNAVIGLSDQKQERVLKDQARRYLMLARRVLHVFGPEGDNDGPLKEIAILDELL